jgi:hypothetical protein
MPGQLCLGALHALRHTPPQAPDRNPFGSGWHEQSLILPAELTIAPALSGKPGIAGTWSGQAAAAGYLREGSVRVAI